MSMEILILAVTGKIPCMFHAWTGLYCPGCGGTRAVKALLRGQIWVSVLYHPLVLYCALVAMIFLVSYLIYWKTKDVRFRLYLENGWIYLGLAIVVMNFAVKNFFLIGKGIDILAMLPPV